MRSAGRFVGALVIAVAEIGAPAAARADDDVETSDDDDDAGSDEIVSEDKPKPKPKPEPTEFKKQDLRGHAVDADASSNVFLKNRFFADKVDTKKTATGTLVQGSLSTSTFAYVESGGTLGPMLGDAGSKFSRMFGELRLQTDFRHIGGGRWDARVDARVRAVNSPTATSVNSVTPTRVQSGFNGTNELDLREAWIVRSGQRSDLFFGRQFITDLGALKIDGLRVDYASSEQFTLIGFGGLYPLRGSRSLTTDYIELKDNNLNSAGRFVGSGGFGAAYRTLNAHGAFGGVALVPFSSEAPRVYGTANGYWRSGSKLDLYHFAIIDVVGSAGFALTNLSAGANFKPHQRLRLTASVNHVDTETLNVQANAFLSQPQPGAVAMDGAVTPSTTVQNEAFIRRLSTNTARGGVSAGLGALQRFEASTAVSYRYRPAVTLLAPDNTTKVALAAAQGVDIFFALIDRRSFADLRLGVDVSRSFGVGSVAYQRSEVFAGRLFAAREQWSGRGEWEVEVGYATTKDKAAGITCTLPDQCFGTTSGTILSLGGNVYYRFNANWFGLGSLFVSRQNLTRNAGAITEDPAVTGFTGFLRVAYRF